jgi:cytochrome c oxidase cbb3-type subunit 1
MSWNVFLTIRAGEKGINPVVPLKNPDARDPALVGPTPVLA